jgi:hypothetical protein
LDLKVVRQTGYTLHAQRRGGRPILLELAADEACQHDYGVLNVDGDIGVINIRAPTKLGFDVTFEIGI